MSGLAAFLAVAAVVIVTPGQDTALTIRNALAGGRRAGVATASGVSAGQAVWAVATSVGLAALVVASEPVFRVLQLAGAAYLVYLGVRRLLERTPVGVEPEEEPLRRAFARGTVVNVLNPKTALFFLAFLPQFVDAGRGAVWSQAVALGLVFVALGLVSDSLYAIAAGFAGGFLRNHRRVLRYGSGSVFVALGALTALARRTS